MRPITEAEIPKIFELFEQRWRRAPGLAEFGLYKGWDTRTERPFPRAELFVWPRGEAGVRLCVAAWHTDRARLQRFRDDLPRLFAAGPLVWDGVPLRGGGWTIQISDSNAGKPEDGDEWSPTSLREADRRAPTAGGFKPVACQACHAVVMIPANDPNLVVCPDCHALDEALAAEAEDVPSREPAREPLHPLVHLLGAESRWWAPGHEPAKGSPWWSPDQDPS
jgi:hypothetical protein